MRLCSSKLGRSGGGPARAPSAPPPPPPPALCMARTVERRAAAGTRDADGRAGVTAEREKVDVDSDAPAKDDTKAGRSRAEGAEENIAGKGMGGEWEREGKGVNDGSGCRPSTTASLSLTVQRDQA